MSQFREFYFWSDSGPHFCSKEMLGFICNYLPSVFPEKLFSLNFFTEYHGKSVVDGHFGVLSWWFSQGETARFIQNLEDLILYFKEKARSEFCRFQVDFDIYSRHG